MSINLFLVNSLGIEITDLVMKSIIWRKKDKSRKFFCLRKNHLENLQYLIFIRWELS